MDVARTRGDHDVKTRKNDCSSLQIAPMLDSITLWLVVLSPNSRRKSKFASSLIKPWLLHHCSSVSAYGYKFKKKFSWGHKFLTGFHVDVGFGWEFSTFTLTGYCSVVLWLSHYKRTLVSKMDGNITLISRLTSCAARATKFAVVFGTTFPNKPTIIFPAGLPSISISRNTVFVTTASGSAETHKMCNESKDRARKKGDITRTTPYQWLTTPTEDPNYKNVVLFMVLNFIATYKN